MPIKIRAAILGLKTKSPAPDREKAQKALDALLAVDSTKPTANDDFDAALAGHIEFWKTQDSDDPLKLEAENMLELKQLAAEQRVLLGLKNASTQVLVDLFAKQNEGALRVYLNDITNKKLGQAVEWKPTPTAPSAGQSILTTAVLDRIKLELPPLLLAKKIAESTNKDQLHALVVARNEPDIKAAVRGLGVPYDLHPVAKGLIDAAKDLYIKQAYPDFLASATPSLDDLNTKIPDLLKSGDEELFKKLIRKHLRLEDSQELSSTQVKNAKAQLATFYLQHVLSNPTLAIKAEEINAIDNVEKMVAFVKGPPVNQTHENITAGITEDSLVRLKTAMVNNVVAQLTVVQVGALTKLSAAKKVEEITPLLEQMGIKPTTWIDTKAMQQIIDVSADRLTAIRKEQMAKPLPVTKLDDLIALAQMKTTELTAFRAKFTPHNEWIDTPQMLQLQQKACNQALALKVESLSTLGPGQHAALIDVLQRLPIKKQLELLDSSKPTLGHLLRSINEAEIKHYLGEEIALDPVVHVDAGQLISKVIAENERIASFQKIHNHEFAKVLASFASPMMRDGLPKIEKLTPEQITALNEKLKTVNLADGNARKDLADIVIRPLPVAPDVRDAFAIHVADNKAAIEKQAAINKPLEDIYAARTPVGKAVLDVFLRLNVDVKYGADSDAFGKALADALQNPKNTKVDAFIEDLCKNAAIVDQGDQAKLDNLKAALKREFSPTEFARITLDWKKQALSDPAYNSAVKMGVLNSIVTTMQDIKPLLKPADPLGTLAKTEFSGFVYDARTLNEGNPALKKEQYMERLANNTVTIDRLLRAQQQLKDCLAVLPAKPDEATKASIEKIRKELDNDLKLINAALVNYELGQKKLISTIKDIDRIMTNKEHYLYHAHDITHRALTPTENAALRGGTFVSVSNAATGIAAKVALESGAKSHLCTVIDNSTPSKPTTGTFTQTIGETSRSQVNSDGTISKRPNIKIEMTQPPTVLGTGASGPEHTHARMYLNMALAMIVANGGQPPSKDNPYYLKGGNDAQMEGLWTALHIICKEKYGYSHSKFMDSVVIQTGGFDPAKVMTPGRFPWSEPKFNDESQFAKVFHHPLSKNLLQDKLNDAGKVKTATTDQTAAIVSAGKALTDYKEEMSNGRASQAVEKAREVRATEGVVTPDPTPSELRHS